jgi:alpha-tubulin suppressor-like RCC1 family protein
MAMVANMVTSQAPMEFVFVSGRNANGQLGLNNTIFRSSPVQLGSGNTWSMIASSEYNTTCVGVKNNGTLWGWGNNLQGQLGLNNTVSRLSPVQIGALTNWAAAATAEYACAAIKTDGTLWILGHSAYRRSGMNDNVSNRSSPVQIGSNNTWSKIVGGSNFLVVKTDGTLWTWGDNYYGQLGQNDNIGAYRSSPIQVGPGTTWSEVSISAGGTVLGIKTNGTLWSWGQNSYGQLGHNTGPESPDYIQSHRSVPTQIGALTNWLKVSAGSTCMLIKSNGTLWHTGDSNGGGISVGPPLGPYYFNKSSPVQVGSDTNWSDAKVGGQNGNVRALKTNGELWVWGSGFDGDLGNNKDQRIEFPEKLGTSNTWNKLYETYNFAASRLI